MTLVRLGYVAMSMELKNASPSQTMTFTQFQKIADREAAIRKLERIARSNLTNYIAITKTYCCIRNPLLPINFKTDSTSISSGAFGLGFYHANKRFIKGTYIQEHQLRVDFHPDHFVLLNTPNKDVFHQSILTLKMHYLILKEMKIDPTHRCVIHVGGKYMDKEKSLEQFIETWMDVPTGIQKLIMLENDDTSFTLEDTLYLCQKLNIPLVFDYHHHLALHQDSNWQRQWDSIVQSWEHSPLPIKMHISSPKSEKSFRHHADYIDSKLFFDFLHEIRGSIPQIDCMIEAKQKDKALFKLMEEIKNRDDVEVVDGSSFNLK
ncbi:UV DNA damage repair endonuclease UvsE [Ornithinibacillus sp. JPR2-1]|uniref:UV DNA damage repair endonuclease UvsE n=1 Tax=Ornithinibacillus sp. JPR2-1 TaxID=2094019 RepID=UPI0031CDF88B